MKNIKLFAAAFSVIMLLGSCDKKAVPNNRGDEEVSTAVVGELNTAVPEKITYSDAIGAPVFSCDSGFFSDEFELTLSTDEEGMEIRYTTDGSVPTPSSQLYTEPLKIVRRSGEPNILSSIEGLGPESAKYIPKTSVAKGTVIRAAVFNESGISGPVQTNTYFVGLSQAEKYNSLPVVSLSTDAYNLFDYEKGIYISGKAYDDWKQTSEAREAEEWEYEGNYSQKGRDWERPVHIELIEPDGKVHFEQDLGMRIMGKATRTYNQKSFRMYAREEYGEKKIKYPLIPGLATESSVESELCEYKTFLLRNGGNDCDYAKLRDPFIQAVMSGRAVATQGSRPAVVFINGEYWGVYAIEEDYTDNSIQYNYGVDDKNVVMIKKGELEEGEDEDIKFYNELESLIMSDLSKAENYSRLCERADMQSFADYFAAIIYTANEDCMTIGDNNWRIWRSRSVSDMPYEDGKWRFLLYDTEFSLGLYKGDETVEYDTLEVALEHSWFGSLMKNREFAKLFETSLLETAEAFKPENSFPVLDGLVALYRPVAADSFKRFGPAWLLGQNSDTGSLEGYYDSNIDQIKQFLAGRYDYIPKMLEKSMPEFE